MENTNRIYRSRTDKMIGGVASGLAKYFNIDVILMRLLFVIIFFAGGGGILIYVILWIIIPLEPFSNQTFKQNTQPPPSTENAGNSKPTNNKTFVAGIILILIGFIFLLNSIFPQFHFRELWPVILIIIGIMIMVNEISPNKGKASNNTESNNFNYTDDNPSTPAGESNNSNTEKKDSDFNKLNKTDNYEI
jgi:phage shock protein PspC (stress-responsive transcriptional regulator)